MSKKLILILLVFLQYVVQAQDKTRTYYADEALMPR